MCIHVKYLSVFPLLTSPIFFFSLSPHSPLMHPWPPCVHVSVSHILLLLTSLNFSTHVHPLSLFVHLLYQALKHKLSFYPSPTPSPKKQHFSFPSSLPLPPHLSSNFRFILSLPFHWLLSPSFIHTTPLPLPIYPSPIFISFPFSPLTTPHDVFVA